MAKVFLSYDHDDTERARPIALALEKAGHSVWWDLHIKGGAQYGKVIEEAVANADAVVVLWSHRSIDSAWVRDEAAAGRDSGRLIPVLIDPVSPPMGFRQYQNLDFGKWSGRGKPPGIIQLLESIEACAGATPAQDPPIPKVARPSFWQRPRSKLFKWSAVAGAIVLAIAAAAILIGYVQRPQVQTVVVTAADAKAGPLARDLLVKLSELQGAKSGSMRLLGQSPAADFTFEVASNADPSRLGANLVLMAGEENEILWSNDFEQPSGNLADLKQQMAFTAANVLACTLEGLSERGRLLGGQMLKLYLNACSQLLEGDATSGGDPRVLIRAFTHLTQKEPNFAPAWSGLLIAQLEITSTLNSGSNSDAESLQALRTEIERARKLHPNLPEISIAEIYLLPPTAHLERMRLIDEAKRRSPDNSGVLANRSDQLRAVGRAYEGIEDAEHALAADPISPYALSTYISALAYSGRIDAAREQLAKAERLWPGTAALLDIQYRFHLRFGDPKLALRLAYRFGAGKGTLLFLEASAEPTSANIEAMREYFTSRIGQDAGMLAGALQAFGHFDLNDELYQIVLPWRDGETLAKLADIWFRPQLQGFRRDPRFMLVMKRTGHVDYWRRSGKWPDFCLEPGLPYDCKEEAAKLAN